MNLRAVNTHFVANAGLGLSGVSLTGVTAAIVALFAKLRDPAFVMALWHDYLNHTFTEASATLVALCMGVIGAALVAALGALAAYLGRPLTIPQPPADAGKGPS